MTTKMKVSKLYKSRNQLIQHESQLKALMVTLEIQASRATRSSDTCPRLDQQICRGIQHCHFSRNVGKNVEKNGKNIGNSMNTNINYFINVNHFGDVKKSGQTYKPMYKIALFFLFELYGCKASRPSWLWRQPAPSQRLGCVLVPSVHIFL